MKLQYMSSNQPNFSQITKQQTNFLRRQCPSHKISNATSPYLSPPAIKPETKHPNIINQRPHRWFFFLLFFFWGGETPIPPITPEIFSIGLGDLPPSGLALTSTALRGPTHRIGTNGIGYLGLARARGRQQITLPP